MCNCGLYATVYVGLCVCVCEILFDLFDEFLCVAFECTRSWLDPVITQQCTMLGSLGKHWTLNVFKPSCM